MRIPYAILGFDFRYEANLQEALFSNCCQLSLSTMRFALEEFVLEELFERKDQVRALYSVSLTNFNIWCPNLMKRR